MKIASNFGLLDKFQVQGIDERDLGLELGSREEATLEERGDKGGHDDKKGAPWEKFEKTIKTLNKKAPRNTAYKVLYLARHGQGYHVRPLIPTTLALVNWVQADRYDLECCWYEPE